MQTNTNDSLEHSVVTAMDGTDVELFPFLPYILQDIWEIGSCPQTIIDLVRRNTTHHDTLSMLDLGCGKGAVSIQLAKELGLSCVGIDAVPEFIDGANRQAREWKVHHLCRFEVGDIREEIQSIGEFDIVLLGSIGPVLGDLSSTLQLVSSCLPPQGIVVLDEGYIEDKSSFSHPLIQKESVVREQIENCNMEIVAEVVGSVDDIKESDEQIFENLKQRCEELMEKHPEKRSLFERYIEKQVEENDVLETKVISSTMVLRIKP